MESWWVAMQYVVLCILLSWNDSLQQPSMQDLKNRLLRDYPPAAQRIADVYGRLEVKARCTVYPSPSAPSFKSEEIDQWHFVGQFPFFRVERALETQWSLPSQDGKTAKQNRKWVTMYGRLGRCNLIQKEGEELRAVSAFKPALPSDRLNFLRHDFDLVKEPYCFSLTDQPVVDMIRDPNCELIKLRLDHSDDGTERFHVDWKLTLKGESANNIEGSWTFLPQQNWVIIQTTSRVDRAKRRLCRSISYQDQIDGVPLVRSAVYTVRLLEGGEYNHHLVEVKSIAPASSATDKDFTPEYYGIHLVRPTSASYFPMILITLGIVGLLISGLVKWRIR